VRASFAGRSRIGGLLGDFADLDTRFLEAPGCANLEVVRHDVRIESFADASFDLIHARAVLMHLADRMSILKRIPSWLTPGGWLVIEDSDFGMWMGDDEPLWAAHPRAWHEAFPNGSLSQGRALLRQIHQLGLEEIAADAELDIVQSGTPLAEFHRLSLAATASATIAAGARTPGDAEELARRLDEPEFLACGFAHIGAWARELPPGGARSTWLVEASAAYTTPARVDRRTTSWSWARARVAS
jgi:SAM-dependent methyltransferase